MKNTKNTKIESLLKKVSFKECSEGHINDIFGNIHYKIYFNIGNKEVFMEVREWASGRISDYGGIISRKSYNHLRYTTEEKEAIFQMLVKKSAPLRFKAIHNNN